MMLSTFDPVAEIFSAIRRDMTGNRVSLPLRAIAADDALVIDLHVPGVASEDVSLDVEGRALTVTVDRAEAPDRVLIDEVGSGRMSRRLIVNSRYDLAGAEADLADGVLRIRVPVSESALARRIVIGDRSKVIESSGVADTTEVG